MIDIFPVINVASFEEVKEKIRAVESHVPWVHIDVSDGSFTPVVSWHTPADLEGLKTALRIEIHFMVREPERTIAEWFLPPVSRIIFHHEATSAHAAVIRACREHAREVGLAIIPETPWKVTRPFFDSVDLIQTLAVSPGPSGQSFDERTLSKVRAIRGEHAHIPIEVDGGIRVGTARACREAGATILVASSSLFDTDKTFREALALLRHDVSS